MLGREKLIAKLIKGPAISQADLGDPLSADGTRYRLCIYGDDDTLAGELGVSRAGDTCGTKSCWKSIGQLPPNGKGFRYKDGNGVADGVRTLKLKGGSTGKSVFLAKAANKSSASMPTGITAELQGDSSATIQVRSSDAECFSANLSDVRKSDSDFFNAKE